MAVLNVQECHHLNIPNSCGWAQFIQKMLPRSKSSHKHVQQVSGDVICHHDGDIIFCFPVDAAVSQTPEPESPVARETISVKLLTSVRPRGPASSSPAAIGRNSQEQLVSDHWFSALDLSQDLTVCTHIAGTRFHLCIFKCCLSSGHRPSTSLPSRLVFVLSLSEILSLSSLINTLNKENIRFRFQHGPVRAADKDRTTPSEVLPVHCVSIVILSRDFKE